MERYKTLFTVLAIFITILNAIGTGVVISKLGELFPIGNPFSVFMVIIGIIWGLATFGCALWVFLLHNQQY